jgi:hypothetical protein
MSVAFVDTETTGLQPGYHELWEIALIVDGEEHEFRFRPQHLRRAQPDSLRINRFYDRLAEVGPDAFFSRLSTNQIAWEVARLTAGRHLVGAVPSFDERFLTDFLHAEGYAPAWHYHLVDVEALVAGRLGIAPPWDSDALSEAIGVPISERTHVAIEDAQWARAMYYAALNPSSP